MMSVVVAVVVGISVAVWVVVVPCAADDGCEYVYMYM